MHKSPGGSLISAAVDMLVLSSPPLVVLAICPIMSDLKRTEDFLIKKRITVIDKVPVLVLFRIKLIFIGIYYNGNRSALPVTG